MRTYSLTHLSDAILLRDLAALVARDRLTTVALLAHIAEVDARRLYVPAGYPSMHAYCVEDLRLSEDAAFKRIRAARAGRQFPALLEGLAEGRFHLSGICVLAPHLTAENAEELLEATAFRRKSEIEEILVRRFGAPELLPSVPTIVPILHAETGTCATQLAPGRVVKEITKSHPCPDGELDASHVDDSRALIATPSPELFLVKVTVDRNTHDKLRYAQALLSHAVPSGDVAQVLDRALDVLIAQLEKRKFGADARSAPQRRRTRAGRPTRTGRRSAEALGGRRQTPAHVRRAVWERDQGQCTFVSASGHRCGARRFLEYDHIDPVARGGGSTVAGMRLRCRAHNQYEAERVFGKEFMDRKRAAREATQDVVAGLRGLGCRADEARRAAELSETLPGATLQERVCAALRFLGRKSIESGTSAEVARPG